MDNSITQDKTFWFLVKNQMSNISLCLKVIEILKSPDDFFEQALKEGRAPLIVSLLDQGMKIPNDKILDEMIRGDGDVLLVSTIFMYPQVVFNHSYLLSARHRPDMFSMLLNHRRCGVIPSSIMIKLLHTDTCVDVLEPFVIVNDDFLTSLLSDPLEYLMKVVNLQRWKLKDGQVIYKHLIKKYWNHPEFKEFVRDLISRFEEFIYKKIIMSMANDLADLDATRQDFFDFMFYSIPLSAILFGFRYIIDTTKREDIAISMTRYISNIGPWISYAITKEMFSLAKHMINERGVHDSIDQQQINRAYLLCIGHEENEDVKGFIKLLYDENLITDQVNELASSRKQTPAWITNMVKNKDSIDQDHINNIIARLEKIRNK